MSAHVPLMTRTEVSRIPGILTSKGNPTSYVQVDGRNNMSYVLTDLEPWSGLDPDGRGPVPEIPVE